MKKTIEQLNDGFFVTGSRRGYIPVARDGAEGELIPMPSDISIYRGNIRWALGYFAKLGATHYTITDMQGVPGKGYSKQYCYRVYHAYIIK